jgi:aminopeptidase N
MRSRQFARAFLFATFCTFAVGFADGQTQRRNFNRLQTYDVEHYTIRASFDRVAKKVIGDTTIRFRPLKGGTTSADFDAVGLAFTSVTLEPSGTRLRFRATAGTVSVTLDRAYSAADVISIRFKYDATPKKGVYFIPQSPPESEVKHSDQIWTQGEPDEARHWFPSFDFPSDRATTEQFLTAGADEAVIGNGELVSQVKNGDGTVTSHYRMAVPIPTYLVSFVIGKYKKEEEKYRDIPLGYYVYPGTESIVPAAYGKTKDMMKFFEEVTRVDYPFNKYDQTIVAGFTFGGMENVTATTMADTEILAAKHPLIGPQIEDLVSHELAHSWFGNLVTCRNWAELWLNEGFATFMEAAFRERMYGRRTYMNKVRSDAEAFITDEATNPKRHALYNQRADRVSELFDRAGTTYNKGGAVLHMLREEIGNDAFWKGVNIYLNRHRLGNVESTDLRDAMEEASGEDLNWFFDQWVYMGGYPKLNVRHIWNQSSKTLTLTATQTQKADSITPSVFRLPMEVEFSTGEQKKRDKLNITKRLQTFSYKLEAKPSAIVVDPDEKVIVKTTRLLP